MHQNLSVEMINSQKERTSLRLSQLVLVSKQLIDPHFIYTIKSYEWSDLRSHLGPVPVGRPTYPGTRQPAELQPI